MKFYSIDQAKMKLVKIMLVFSLFLLTLSENTFEKFFEIDGGPDYMYYFAKLQVGSSNLEQSAIIDTGSDTLAFPCDYCESKDCGTHQDPRYQSAKSSTFKFDIQCYNHVMFHSNNVCQFTKSYAEGSTLLGFLAVDYLRFKNTKSVSDMRLQKLNTDSQKDLKMKAEFGCTTKETGLFKTQYADGILGLDNGSTFITSIEEKNSIADKKVFSFGLCFHNSGGIMSVDLRKEHRKDTKISVLNQKPGTESKPIVVKYNTINNYYEVEAVKFEIANIQVDLYPINVMIDSGTTFTHFPTPYIKAILKTLNTHCAAGINRCGNITNAIFTEESCLEYKQPDETYKTIQDLLDSFPEIKIYFSGATQPFIIYPKNYFYQEFNDDRSSKEIRLCMSLKGEEYGRIILGAFSMIDNYFYFDRKAKVLKIYKEDCYLRTNQILMKERVLEEINFANLRNEMNWLWLGLMVVGGCVLVKGLIRIFGKKNKDQ